MYVVIHHSMEQKKSIEVSNKFSHFFGIKLRESTATNPLGCVQAPRLERRRRRKKEQGTTTTRTFDITLSVHRELFSRLYLQSKSSNGGGSSGNVDAVDTSGTSGVGGGGLGHGAGHGGGSRARHGARARRHAGARGHHGARHGHGGGRALGGGDSGGVGAALGVLGLGAAIGDANGLGLGTGAFANLSGGRALHAKGAAEGVGNSSDVILGNAKGGGSSADLADEVGQLSLAEVHELVDLVHGGLAVVLVEAGHALLGAAEEGAEELVQVGEEEVLVGRSAGGGHVLLQAVQTLSAFGFFWGSTCAQDWINLRLSTAIVKEVLADGLVATVGGGEGTIEVGQKVDLLAVDLTRGKDTGNGNTNVGHGVCWSVS